MAQKMTKEDKYEVKLKERLLHVGLQRINQYCEQHTSSEGRRDLGAYVWWSKIKTLS